MMDWAIREAEALALPCFDLVPAAQGDQVVGYWGGARDDLPSGRDAAVGAILSAEHIISVDGTVWERLGLKGRHPFALVRQELCEDLGERTVAVPVNSAALAGVAFPGAVPLKAVESVSLPPLEALLLYGGLAVDSWLRGRGLRRWDYTGLTRDETKEDQSYVDERSLLTSQSPPFARAGGWHIPWPDDDFYIPREMRLMLWTFQDSEPWYEVFLNPMRFYTVKTRIT